MKIKEEIKQFLLVILIVILSPIIYCLFYFIIIPENAYVAVGSLIGTLFCYICILLSFKKFRK